MTIDKRIAYAFILGLAFSWWMNSGAAPTPSPFNPAPTNDRPVLRFIAKAAKNALWFLLIAEPAPDQTERQMAQHIIGDDGHPIIDHARAF